MQRRNQRSNNNTNNNNNDSMAAVGDGDRRQAPTAGQSVTWAAPTASQRRIGPSDASRTGCRQDARAASWQACGQKYDAWLGL